MLISTNMLLVMCSHRGMHANPEIDESGGTERVARGSGGMLQIFVSFWCNLRL